MKENKKTEEKKQLCFKGLHFYDTKDRYCKECRREYTKVYRDKNKQKLAEKMKEYQRRKKDRISRYQKRYRISNKKNKTEYDKRYRKEPKNAKRISSYLKNKRNTDPFYRFTVNLRGMVKRSFQRKGWKKSSKTQQILGCTFEELKAHLESTAVKNYGSFDPAIPYEIDHIIPMSMARNEVEVEKLNHYTNLQYLTKLDNLRKSKKIIDISNGQEVVCPIAKNEILEIFLKKI